MRWLNIQHLRSKPKVVRNQIALSVATVCTALVFSVWVMADPAGVSTIVQETDQPRPFGSILDQLSEQVAGVRAAITTPDTTPEPDAAPVILSNPSPGVTPANREIDLSIVETALEPTPMPLPVAVEEVENGPLATSSQSQ